MNSEQFIDLIRELTIDDSVRIVQSNLIKPPGRNPSDISLNMSKWYNNLDDKDKAILIQIIKKSVRTGVFEFLCILDGAIAIESKDKGELKLYYEKGKEQVLLNDQSKVNLHELL
jgi:hypothetical protein